ncbi:unnamed protein product, partial [Prorocentrum cordatum]
TRSLSAAPVGRRPARPAALDFWAARAHRSGAQDPAAAAARTDGRGTRAGRGRRRRRTRRRGPLAGTARGAPCPAAARGGRAGASGVRPSSSCALRSALAFASSCVVTSTPSFTAPCSGVSPCLFRASIGAPRCSSRPAIST